MRATGLNLVAVATFALVAPDGILADLRTHSMDLTLVDVHAVFAVVGQLVAQLTRTELLDVREVAGLHTASVAGQARILSVAHLAGLVLAGTTVVAFVTDLTQGDAVISRTRAVEFCIFITTGGFSRGCKKRDENKGEFWAGRGTNIL